MKERRISVRIREADRDWLKENFKCSTAAAIHKLIWGPKEEQTEITKAYVKDYLDSELMNYVKERMDSIRNEMLSSVR